MAEKELIEKLKQMLKELFQFENNDLDFGIYRIINIKRKEISDFIEKELFDIIKKEIGNIKDNESLKKELENLLKEIEKTFGCEINDAIKKYNDTPKIKEFIEKEKEIKKQSAEVEAEEEIYNNIINFFSCYYDNGDFVSKRRYSRKPNYMIPYNGEEVYLHWANNDQYYIKTAENFTNYKFKIKAFQINFESINEEIVIEENNNKSLEENYFILSKLICPNENLINLFFAYRKLTNEEEKNIKKEFKEKKIGKTLINQFNLKKIKQELILINSNVLDALNEKHKKLDGNYSEKSELEWHLNIYTTKNKSDYFIHKDLERFLKQELEFFITNRIISLNNLYPSENFNLNLKRIEVFKNINYQIIHFLAQIENFQKKIWEKKKFVIATNYCITLDLIDEKYYSKISENKNQLNEWKRLYSFDIEKEKKISKNNLTDYIKIDADNGLDILKQNSSLIIDTKYFDDEFKYQILSEINNLDDKLTGILIKSENFQALNLLQEKYHKKIGLCYLDPPYNTEGDRREGKFLYKDGFAHSTWLSLIEGRIVSVKDLLDEKGIIISSIDDNEVCNLRFLFNQIFGENNFIAQLPTIMNLKGNNDEFGFAGTHEYTIIYSKSKEKAIINEFPLDDEELADWMQDEYGWYKKGANLQSSGVNAPREKRPNLYFPIYINVQNEISLEKRNDVDIELLPLTNKKEMSWRWSKEKILSEPYNIIVSRTGNNISLYKKQRPSLSDLPSKKPKTLFYKPEYSSGNGTNLQKDLFGVKNFPHPKPLQLIKDFVQLCTNKKEIVLDIFAGSGTTGHAVIELNKEDEINRKFILIDMGQFFDSILKSRILKAIHSGTWKEGKPQNRNGSKKQIIKYQILEQYEDSMYNIKFKNLNLLALNSKEYKIKYMLDFETKESKVFLNIDSLDNPFEYTLEIEENNEKKIFNIDLVETFNYIAAIFVDKIIKKQDNNIDYIIVKGKREEKKVVVIWRNKSDSFNPEQDKEFVENEVIAGEEYDEIFVNGSSLIENAISLDEIFKKSMIGE